MDYVVEVVRGVGERMDDLRGYRIVAEPPTLRYFTARFAPLD
jgi:tryptophanase